MADIRVTMFDDNQRIRESLTMLFKNAPGFVFCGAYPDCSNVVDHIAIEKPDVVLMDIDMPGLNGIGAVKLIKESNPELCVLMLTVFDDDQKIFDAICAGADGYILKKTSLERLLDAVREAHQGGAPMTPSIARKVLALFQNKNTIKPNDEFNLSAREKDVLALLVDGASYKMIADKLEIGYDTVHSHIKRIYKKLHVNSMSEAVAKALRNNLT